MAKGFCELIDTSETNKTSDRQQKTDDEDGDDDGDDNDDDDDHDNDGKMTPVGGSELLKDFAVSGKTLLAPEIISCVYLVCLQRAIQDDVGLDWLIKMIFADYVIYGKPAKIVENEEVAGRNQKTFEELEAGVLFITITNPFHNNIRILCVLCSCVHLWSIGKKSCVQKASRVKVNFWILMLVVNVAW